MDPILQAASYVVAAAASAALLAVAAIPAARPGHQCTCRLPVSLLVSLPGLFCKCSVSLARKENTVKNQKGEHIEKNAQALPNRCTSRHDSPAY
jgi:hypothetical protein